MKTILLTLTILAGLAVADLPAQALTCTEMCGPIFCTTRCW